ncbi:MAG TPA: MATE family efflux transporter, partial [Gemmatimonadales bacterium]|nr:MATE family efflux transporter [Gemmatimonadales bacterium]
MSTRPANQAFPSRPSRLVPTARELKDLLRLAVPVVVVQVGIMLMGVVDSIMVGHLSANALASVALGNMYFMGLAIFGMGVLLALDPLVAQAVGAGDHTAIARALQRGLVLALVLSVPCGALLLTVDPVLSAIGEPPELIPYASLFTSIMIPSVVP